MDNLPDEILLRIFGFLAFITRIALRLVSWRWMKLLFDHSLLQQVVINDKSCEDHQLEPLMSAAKQVVGVDFFNCCYLTGSCLMSAELSRLQSLTLLFSAVNDGMLVQILNACQDELVELNLAGTIVSLSKCLPTILKLKKLRHFSAPLRDKFTPSGRRAIVELAERCQTLRTLDCQEGYSLDRDNMSRIVDANPRLTSLVIPFSSVYDDTVLSIVENLSDLRYLCICETHVTKGCVHWIKSSKATLELCCADA